MVSAGVFTNTALRGRPALVLFSGAVPEAAQVARELGVVPWVLEEEAAAAKRARRVLSGLGGKTVRGRPEDFAPSGFAALVVGVPEGEEARARAVAAEAVRGLVRKGVVFLAGKKEAVLEAARDLPVPFWAQADLPGGKAVLAGHWTGEVFPPTPPVPLRPGTLDALFEPEEGPPPALTPKGLEERLLRAARTSPAWAEAEGLSAGGEVSPPLLPLRPAHLVLLVVAGLLDLQEVEIEGRRHLVLGRLKKEKEEGEEEGGRKVARERFFGSLVLLDMERLEVTEVDA